MKKIYFDNSIWNLLQEDKESVVFNELINLVNKKEIQIYISPINIWEIISTFDKEKRKNLINKVNLLSPKFLKNPNEIYDLIFLNIFFDINKNTFIKIEDDEIFLSNNKSEWEQNWNSKKIYDQDISNKANDEKENIKKNALKRCYKFFIFYKKLIEHIISKDKILLINQKLLEEYLEKNNFIQNFFNEIISNLSNNNIEYLKHIVDNIKNNKEVINIKNIKYYFLLLNKQFLKIEIISKITNIITNNEEKKFIDILKYYYSFPITRFNKIKKYFYENLNIFLDNQLFVFLASVSIGVILKIFENIVSIKPNGDIFDYDQLIYSKYADMFFLRDNPLYRLLPKENKEIYNKFKNIQKCSEIIEILREVTNENKNSINC